MKFLLDNAPLFHVHIDLKTFGAPMTLDDVMKEHTFCHEAPSAHSTDKRQNTMMDSVLVLQIS